MRTTNYVANPTSGAMTGGLATEQPKLMYSKKEAAETLSVSVRTVEYLIAGGELASRRVGKRVLIPYQSLLQFTRQDHKTGRPQ